MAFPTGPAQSYSNPNGIPGLSGFTISSSNATPVPNNPSKASSPEPGEIVDGPYVDQARIIAIEAKMAKLEKDNEALRQLVAHLCKGVAKLSDNMPKIAQTAMSDAVLEKMASDMSATVLDGASKPMSKIPDMPMADHVIEETTGDAENGHSSITIQYLTKSQEKVTKEFLAIQKRMTNLETNSDKHQKSIAKDRGDSHDAQSSQKKTSDQMQSEIKDIKRKLDLIVSENDHARRTDLHHRIKITMQMRHFKEQHTQLWDRLYTLAAFHGRAAVDQVVEAQAGLQRGQSNLNFVASKLYNAALAGPLPAQTYHLHQTRRDLHEMRSGRALVGPNNTRIMLSPDDITMLTATIDQIEDFFKLLRKANPRWEGEIKSQEAKSKQAGFNNGNAIKASTPVGPKRAREEEEREREYLDRELDRGRIDRYGDRYDGQADLVQQRSPWARQTDRSWSFGNKGYVDRFGLENPKRRR